MFELMPGNYLEALYRRRAAADPDTNSYPVSLLVDAPDNFSARPGNAVGECPIHHPSLLDADWIPPEALFDPRRRPRPCSGASIPRLWRHKVAAEIGARALRRAETRG